MEAYFVTRTAIPAAAILLFGFTLLAQQTSQNSKSENKSDSATDDKNQVYRVGTAGLIPPRATYAPDPEYSDKARKKKLNGTVILALVVGTDGRPRDITIKQSPSADLNQSAIAALKQWKFTPGTKDGQPVPVALDVEMSFRLY
jgi:TonB family protein